MKQLLIFSVYVVVGIFMIAPLQGMHLDFVMSSLEKRLVLREIERSGVMLIELTVDNAAEQTWLENGWIISPTILNIQMQFNKEDAEKDSLTKDVFETVAGVDAGRIGLPGDTNHYWLRDDKSVVLIVSNMSNKTALQALIRDYKSRDK